MKNAGLAGAIALCGIGLIGHSHFSGVDGPAYAEPSPWLSFSSNSACLLLAPEPWFEETPRTTCSTGGIFDVNSSLPFFGFNDGDPLDLDLDGRPDAVPVMPRLFNSVGENRQFGFWDDRLDKVLDPSAIQSSSFFEVQGAYVFGSKAVFDFNDLEFNGLAEGVIRYVFWDVDGDGARDLCVWVSSQISPTPSVMQWYRNINGGRSIAGDVNNDGQVNGADLTIVLSDWTG